LHLNLQFALSNLHLNLHLQLALLSTKFALCKQIVNNSNNEERTCIFCI
jgi:hypothetical protein